MTINLHSCHNLSNLLPLVSFLDAALNAGFTYLWILPSRRAFCCRQLRKVVLFLTNGVQESWRWLVFSEETTQSARWHGVINWSMLTSECVGFVFGWICFVLLLEDTWLFAFSYSPINQRQHVLMTVRASSVHGMSSKKRWSMLTSEQRNRSTRLLAILRSAFATHPRTMMLVSAFVEGVHLHRFGLSHESDDMKGQSANGYELLRQLTLEYSLRTRAEALSLRSLFVNKSYVLSSSETSASSSVSDVI